LKTIFKVTSAVVLSIALFVGTAFLIREYLLPKLPQQWQTDLTWIAGAAATTLAILASLAEFTGYNLISLLSKEESTNKIPLAHDNRGAISLNTGDRSKIDWDGDILQTGSTKIVVPDRNAIESQKSIEPSRSELVSEIQSKLYGDNNRLPYVLTLCLDVCDRIGLIKKYEIWLRAELSGYPTDPTEYYGEFGSGDEGDAWLAEWASHRFIATNVKLVEPGQSVVQDAPFDRVFI